MVNDEFNVTVVQLLFLYGLLVTSLGDAQQATLDVGPLSLQGVGRVTAFV